MELTNFPDPDGSWGYDEALQGGYAIVIGHNLQIPQNFARILPHLGLGCQ